MISFPLRIQPGPYWAVTQNVCSGRSASALLKCLIDALGPPRGMEWGGRREGGSGWGTHVYLWRIHFDIWQN